MTDLSGCPMAYPCTLAGLPLGIWTVLFAMMCGWLAGRWSAIWRP